MRFHRALPVLGAFALGLVGVLPGAATVNAAPPVNDDVAGATVLGPAPFHLEQDTTEATTSAEEAALNEFCGAPAFEQGVWFTGTAAADAVVVVDVTASDYSAGILVLGGEPGNFFPLTCGPGVVSGQVFAGQTLYLVVFGDGLTPATSGQLVLDTFLAPPPPTIDVTIDGRGTVDKDGVAHISGTVTCTSDEEDAFLFEVFGEMRQTVGRFFIDGFFFSEQFTPCDGVVRTWTADVFGDGKFAGGKAATTVIAFGCGSFSCAEGYAEATIHLRKGKQK